MSLLIFNLIIFPFIFSQLILEYKKEIKRDLKTPDEIMLDLIETEYYTNIKIGTPFQNLKINIEFTKNLFYISGDEKYKKYNPTISSSYKLYSPNEIIKDFDLNIKGILSNETIYFNNKKYEDFFFVLSENSTKKSKMYPSSIGLGISTNIYLKYSIAINFINILYLQKKIKSNSFFINQINENEGQIIIGNLPHEYEKIKNDFQKFEVAYSDSVSFYNYWCTEFDKIKYNNLSYYENYMILFDFNLEGIIIGNFYFELLKRDFFQYYIDKNICFENTVGDYNYFYCDKNNKKNIEFDKIYNFSFINKNFNETFEVSYKDLFKEKGDYIFFLAIHNIRLSSTFILGRLFFNKYQLGFNYDRKMVYLYKNDLNQNNKSKTYLFNIFIIILLLIVLFILIYYYVFYCKIKRKLYATELEDDVKFSEKIL
jgi:hypothetical protein